MKNRKFEKKIYECLGVNLFRKYVLFYIEKIWKIFSDQDIIGYRLNNFSIESVKKYKNVTKGFACAHFLVFIISFPDMTTVSDFLFNLLSNGYCIMVQRYNSIRIDETVEKYEKLMEKRKNKYETNGNNDVKSEKDVHKGNVSCSKKEELIELKNELLVYKIISEQENCNEVSNEDKNLKYKIIK